MRNAMDMPGHSRHNPKHATATASRSLQHLSQTRRPQSQRPQSQRPQSRRRNRKGNPVRCNKCKTPLSGTFFLLKCNCILCEECCCSHFEKNKNCPTCNRIMGENDFTELMVRTQTLEPKIIRQKARQPIFVKKRANSRFFKLPDMYYGLQRRHSVLKEGAKFVLRQFMKETNIQMKRSSQIRHALSAMKEDHDALKLETNKHKQKVETFKQELILANEKLNEKDRQLNQFRKMIGSKSGAPSSRDDSSGRDHSRDHSGTTAKRPRRVSDQHQFARPPTRHGHETSRQRGHSQDRSNPYSTQPRGGNRPSAQPRGNPYNGDFLPSQDQHSHRNRSRKNPYRAQNPHRPPPSRSPSVGTRSTNSGGRIRNITASTPYAFSGSEGRSKLSPSQFYAAKAPRRHHSQSY